MGGVGGCGIGAIARLDGALVPKLMSAQGVQREEGHRLNHVQHRLRLLLQSPPARPLQDHPSPLP